MEEDLTEEALKAARRRRRNAEIAVQDANSVMGAAAKAVEYLAWHDRDIPFRPETKVAVAALRRFFDGGRGR